MNTRARLLLACALSASMMAAGSLAARAADQAMPVKAPPVVAEGWWFHAYMELAGRGFLNDPNRGGILSRGTGDSLAKFYEYRDLRPGAFGDGWFATGTNNGLWQIDGWAKNVGWDDQAYQLNVSKAGEHYATFNWDETPHLRSTSALTIFNGVGTNALTLPPGLSGALFNAAGCTAVANAAPNPCPTSNAAFAGHAATIQTLINANAHQNDIGIRRDTASFEYRYTPTDDWDFRVSYSNMHRHGTMADGVIFTGSTAGGVVNQVPKPVDDVTQNYAASGEYVGTSFWGQRYNWKVGYSGSTYTDKWDSYTVQNPFCGATGFCATNANPSAPIALMSLPPSNTANGVTSTIGAELPWKSRYMGTFSWTNMQQNQSFLPFTISGQIFTTNLTTVGAPPPVPYPSLNGNVNTILSNHVVTTEITSTLKNKASYRFYDYDNGTPEQAFGTWVVNDTNLAAIASTAFNPVGSLQVSYTKQNAGDELVWRPDNHWNLGAAYGLETYKWHHEAADFTYENSGKLFADYKPASDVVARASWLFAQRRYNNYDYVNDMAAIQWPMAVAPLQVATRSDFAMREFYLNNRNRNKLAGQIQWDMTPQITITPSAGLLYDDYLNDPTTQVGLQHNHAWNFGVEATYALDARTTFLVAYMYEHYHQLLQASTATGVANAFAPGSNYFANIDDSVHTVTASVNYTVIPDRLDLKVSYAVALSKDGEPVVWGTLPTAFLQYPDISNVWQRFDAVAKYKFDPDWVHRMGWKGDIYAKLMYAWERNSMGDYQNDMMNTYMFNVSQSTGYMTWMAFDNPNYNVHMIAGSIGLGW